MGMTSDQKKAYLANEGKYLVSAGAGCGKTFVLTQRVLRLILEEDISLDNMLILTFTNAAAASMKSKIRNTISKEITKFNEDSPQYKRLVEQLELVDSASIQTYDSFCNSIVKKYNYDVNVPKSFTLLDASVYSINRKIIVEKIVEDRVKNNDQGVCEYIKFYCEKNTNPLVNTIIKFMDYAQGSGKEDYIYENFINDCYSLNKYAKDEGDLLELFLQVGDRFYNTLARYEDEGLDGYYEAYSLMLEENEKVNEDPFKNLSYFEKWKEIYRPFDRNAPGYKSWTLDQRVEKYKQNVFEHKIIRFTGSSKKEETYEKGLCESIIGEKETAALQTFVKDTIKSEINDLIIGDIEESLERVKYFSEVIVDCAREAKVIVDAQTVEIGSMTFDQIFNKALEALKIPENQKELHNKYKYVFIDEYQDTNPKQEVLINDLLQPDNVFMVGDMKQSIYGFRGADPSLFMDKFDRFMDIDEKDTNPNADGYLITLADNFRSRSEVIHQTNDIFDVVMTKDVGGIDFSEKNQGLKFGNKATYEPNVVEHPGLSSIVYATDKYAVEIEAQLICDDIKDRINREEKVVRNGKLEPCRLSDFAILIRNTTNFDVYKRIFHDNKLSLLIVDDFNISDSSIVRTFKNILRIYKMKVTGQLDLDTFKFAFASIQRSFLNDDEVNRDQILHNILSIEDKDELLLTINSTDIVQKIDNIIHQTKYTKNAEELVEAIFDEFDFDRKILKLNGYKDSFVVLETLKNTAKSFDKLGNDKIDFIDYVQNIYKYQEPISTDRNLSTKDSVTLMTIHKSKGLEFSNIYIPQLSKLHNYGLTSKFEVIDNLGITLPITKSGEANYENCITILGKDKIESDTDSEEIRLFYVALTRAKERAILVYNQDTSEIDASYSDEDIVKRLVPRVDKIKSYADVIFKCYEKQLPFLISKDYDIKLIRENDLPLLNPDRVPLNVDITLDNNENNIDIDFINIENPYEFSEPVFFRRASKEMKELVEPTKIEYGNLLHSSMEIVDIKSKDTSIIKDKKIKNYIDQTLSIDEVFGDITEARHIFKEYQFYDEDYAREGSIDLLIIYDDYIKIIDYKAKNIESPEYDNQLSAYEDYITGVFPDYKIYKYLVSIMDATYREVK